MSYVRLSPDNTPGQFPPASSHMFSSSRRRAGPPSLNNKWRQLLSYAPDWILTIALAAGFFLLDKVPGFRREFSLTDITLRFPFAVHERVPDWALYLIAFVSPLVLQPIINALTVRSLWDFHNSTLGLCFGLVVAGAFTQVAKITVGRPRPDVIARCMPIPGSEDPALGLSTSAICTNTNVSMMRDGWRSFPSGHSSLSFAGLGFLSFYLAGKLHLFDRRGNSAKAWICLIPLMGALLVAISRTMDSRHHWQDVVAGSILGLICAYFSYRQYYPPLPSEFSQLPYAPRTNEDDSALLPTYLQPLSRASSPRLAGHRYTDSSASADQEVLPDGTVRRNNPPLQTIWSGQDDHNKGRPFPHDTHVGSSSRL